MFDGGGKIGYGLRMNDVAEEYDEEELGPSLAIPPLYVLRVADRCPECGQALDVYTLVCAAFHDAEDRQAVQQFHFLSHIRSVPEPLLKLLKARCPTYYPDAKGGEDTAYLMNHCRCGAKLDDEYAHGEVGAPFWPATPDGYRDLTLFRLPIREAIPVECSYSLGGGEYLNIGNAESW